MEKTGKRLPWWAIVLIAAGGAGVLFGLLVAGINIYFRGAVGEYYKASEKAFVIPNSDDGFVAQGISYDDRTGCFFVTGYQNDKTASPISIVNRQNGKTIKRVSMKLDNGSPFLGHSGGISVCGNYVYVAGGRDRCLYVFSYSDIMDVENGDSVAVIGKFDLTSENDGINAAFTTIYDGKLLVGEFYREKNYKTDESHHIEVCGGTNRAIAVAFEIDPEAEFGLKNTVAEAFSLPDQVQGMCFDGDNVYASSSYGMAFSHIYNFDRTRATSRQMNILGRNVTTYLLDDDSLVSDRKIAPMSEEIEIVDGQMYVMCESASDKYIFGKFTGGRWCYATDLDFFKKAA